MAFEQIRKTLRAQLEELEALAAIGEPTDFPAGPAASHEEVVRRAYSAFNERDVDAALALMDPEVDWPNVPKGGFIHGQEQVRHHWREQFRQADPRIELAGVAEKDDGRVEAQVRQIVRAPDGSKLSDDRAVHVFTFAGERIRRMEVRASRV
jgi:ketosteroid isomerase-like protein